MSQRSRPVHTYNGIGVVKQDWETYAGTSTYVEYEWG